MWAATAAAVSTLQTGAGGNQRAGPNAAPPIDIVDIFRRSELVPALAMDHHSPGG